MTSIPRPQQKLATKFNTLQILRGGWYATWAASLLLLVVSLIGVNQQRHSIKTVGTDSAPSILTAQQLRDSFADLDANLANELLVKPGENQQISQVFETNQKKIAERLVAAGKNITYPAEEKIVEKLQLGNSGYLLKLQAARDAHDRNDRVGALNIYRSAVSLLERDILPQAVKLDDVNSKELEKAYSDQGAINKGIILLIILLGLAQIGILATLQVFIARRMRRTFNLPLLGASGISVIFLCYTLSSLLGAGNDLKVAKEDAFDSIHTLRQARALSYMANADESRYLLDVASSIIHDRAFKTKVSQIVSLPPNTSLAQIIKLIPRTDGDVKFTVSSFSGLYATQLENITFPGELTKTIDTLNKLDAYLQIDEQIRQLYRSGKVAEAIALCTGKSNQLFDLYKDANQELRLINEKVFYAKIESGNRRLNYFELIAPIAIGGVAILTLFGVRPRLNEYL